MMTTLAPDLASDLVQECLGFAGHRSKLRALHRIQCSLQPCLVAVTGADKKMGCVIPPSSHYGEDTASRRREWREFLEGQPSTTADEPEFMVRDSLIRCLAEGCRLGDDDNAGHEDEVIVFDVVESSLLCLANLVRLRCAGCDGDGKRKKNSPPSSAPIFGPEFVSAIAADVVEAFKLDGSSAAASGVPRAASELLVALLRPDRPRNEIDVPAIRDSILLPASAADSPLASVALVAHVLSSSVVAAVDAAVPPADSMENVELSMRRETAALGMLQDVRDVMMNVGLACSEGFDQGEDSAGHITSLRILASLQEIYDIAAFAVESQLETLLDEQAEPILSRLSKESTNQADKLMGTSAFAGVLEEVDSDIEEEGKEVTKLEASCSLSPLYANISKPPVILTTPKNLELTLVAITDSLNVTDAERWDERLNALVDLERILAGGVASMSHEARHMFIEKLRKMPLHDQFTDLRSQITQQVCRVIVAVSYEYRDHVADDSQLNQAVSHFVECCVPSILNLCKSGTRLMATQGMNCLLCLTSVCGSIGYCRTVPRFCDEILGKKVHTNRKRGSVMALTAALRVWDPSCLVRYLDQLTKATKEAATNRDPAVREQGRKLYWAMYACGGTSNAVKNLFDARSREVKNLMKEREDIDSEWEDEGVMSVLTRTGVLGQAPKKTTEKVTKAKSRVPPPNSMPHRSSIKRPASTRLRTEHGTPFKSHRASTPIMKVGGVSSSSKLRPPSASVSRSKQRLSTPSIKHSSAVSPMKFSQNKSSNLGLPRSPKVDRERPSTAPSPLVKSTRPRSEGKENSATMTARTPTKSVGFNVNLNAATPVVGTPVVNLLARASPLSAERVKNTGDILGGIIFMLSDKLSPHQQPLGIKALALFAKEEPGHPLWEEKFPDVLDCLLDHIRSMPMAEFNGPVDFIRSPTKNLNACHQMQHLFLQGVRSLLQFVPGYIKREHVKDVVCCMLECTKDAPFEIVHTAERALHNLVIGTNPEACFECLLPFTSIEIDLEDKNNPPALLSTLRTMRYLVDRISTDSLRKALPSMLPLFHMSLCHKSVDMRKATIFLLVEMHFVFGVELRLDDFTDCQRRLVDIYVDKHPKKSQRTT